MMILFLPNSLGVIVVKTCLECYGKRKNTAIYYIDQTIYLFTTDLEIFLFQKISLPTPREWSLENLKEGGGEGEKTKVFKGGGMKLNWPL